MRLLIVGASGGVGQWLTSLAAARGHTVTALVRAESQFTPPPGVNVVRGDPLDARALDAVVAGQDAVASCIGIRRTGKWPWAAMKSPPDLTERAARALIPVMEKRGVRRLVVVSGGGAADSAGQLTWPVHLVIHSGNIARQYRDLERMEQVLAESTLDWLAVRPVTLVHGNPTGKAHPVTRYRVTSKIRRSDVAAWMLNALEQKGEFPERFVLLAG